jgi:hypothetical protein
MDSDDAASTTFFDHALKKKLKNSAAIVRLRGGV